MDTERKILVTGATGKQGRSLVEAVQGLDFRVLALTRNASSPAANIFKAKSHVEIVQGDLDSEESVRKVFEDAGGKGGIWGVFMVLAFPGLGANADGEEKQGKMLADLALEYNVSAFIFSSVERGGESFDDHLELDRAAKVKIERHVKSLGEKGLRWTILRPAFFMENFDGTIGRVTTTILRCGLKSDTKLQLVASYDIGQVAAAIFTDPVPNASKIYVVAGDTLTAAEQDAAYFQGTGKHLPSIPDIFGRALLSMNNATKGLIHDIERVHRTHMQDLGTFEADAAALRTVYPHMTSFELWARHRQGKVSHEEWSRDWNKVSLGKLMTGRQ